MAFLPTDISGLAAWWDANDAATVTGATPVTQWNDKSGNGRHLTHATLGPNHVPASGVMRFDGPAASTTAGDTLDMPAMTVRTVIFFTKALNPQSASNRYHAILGHSTNGDTLYIDLPAGTPASYGVRPKNGLNKVAINGNAWIAQSVANETVPVPFTLSGDIVLAEYASARTGLTWLGAAGSTRNFRPNLDLAEVLIYDRVLTGEEKQQAEGYLAHKWARADLLPVDHPYKATPPGGVITLDVASAGHAHLVGQASLYVSGTLAADNGTHTHGATSPGLVPGNAIAIADIADQRIFQRIGNAAAVAISGAYAGTIPDMVQARVLHGATVIKDWTTLNGAMIGSGSWSGVLTDVPEGGMYRIEVRGQTSDGTVLANAAGTTEWGVGDIYGLIGSSSAERWFTIGTGYVPHDLLKTYDGSWKAAASMGAAAVTFGNQAIADSGVPVAIMDYGVGGTRLSQWVSTANTSYAAFAAALAAVGPVRAVFVVVGMNDARAGVIPSQAAHEANWRTLIGHIRADAGDPALPILIWGAQRCLQAGMDDQQFGWMRGAERTVGQDANVRLAVTTVDLPLITDNLHLTEAAMVTAAQRMARTVGAMFHGTGIDWRAPEVTAVARVDDTTSDITITHHGGTDFAPVSGITGFEISNDAFVTLLSIGAAVRQSANVIRMTHASTAGLPAQLRYQYGAAPDVTGAVNDNAGLPLPLAPVEGGLEVFSGSYLATADCVHGLNGALPVLIHSPPVFAITPADALHEFGDVPSTLFAALALSSRHREVRIRADPRGLAVRAD